MIFSRQKKELKTRFFNAGYRKAEKIYLVRLTEQTALHIEKIEHLEKELERKRVRDIKETENRLGLEINRIKLQNTDLKKQIRQNQTAWIRFKDYIPDLLNTAQMLKTVRYTEKEAIANKYKIAEAATDKAEYLAERIGRIEGDVERLMGIE